MQGGDGAIQQLLSQLAGADPAAVAAAATAYDNARMDGLCHEGAWEIALALIQAQGVSTAPADALPGHGNSRPVPPISAESP
jgi:hypothetical protein